MTLYQKKELIRQLTELLEKIIEVEQTEPAPAPEHSVEKPLEMLTVKECAALVDGLSENKVAHVRAGAGRNGKILVSKVSLLKYLGIAN